MSSKFFAATCGIDCHLTDDEMMTQKVRREPEGVWYAKSFIHNNIHNLIYCHLRLLSFFVTFTQVAFNSPRRGSHRFFDRIDCHLTFGGSHVVD